MGVGPPLGKVVLASTKAVYVLVPLPLERQIQDLLAGHRVEEALTLAEGARRNIPKDKFQVRFTSQPCGSPLNRAVPVVHSSLC